MDSVALSKKTSVFLWSLTLVIGYRPDILQWMLGLIRSVTTDLCTEIGLVDVPDISLAFSRRLLGVPMECLMGAIDGGSRLMTNALRFAGWSHLASNLIKFACRSISIWPDILTAARHLCRFFRSESWRNAIADALEEQFPEIRVLMKSFHGHFAKWRYEAVPEAFEALLALRPLCQTFLIDVDKILGNKFQEKELWTAVRSACRWTEFWVFIKVFHLRLLMEFA